MSRFTVRLTHCFLASAVADSVAVRLIDHRLASTCDGAVMREALNKRGFRKKWQCSANISLYPRTVQDRAWLLRNIRLIGSHMYPIALRQFR